MGHIGITGSRWGMTDAQKEVALYIYKKFKIVNQSFILHQGMCSGADTEMHDMIKELDAQAQVIGHPPLDQGKFFCPRDCDELREPKDYLERDRDIVDESDIMVATPKENEEVPRGSGTWYTIRYAKKVIKADNGKCKKLYVIKPDGKAEFFDFSKLQDEK